MSTKLRCIDFKKIQQAGPEGILMVRIAIAVNDFISGNYFFEMAKKIKDDPKIKDIRLGLARYSIRIQIGHLSEALLLIHHPKDTEPSLDNLPSLKRFIDNLSLRNKKHYELLRKSLEGGCDRKEFETYVENFRNRVSFHYDTGYRGPRKNREAPVSKEALDYIVKHEKKIGHMLTASNLNNRRFLFADDIMDTAVCRMIWKINGSIKGEEYQKAADEIATWISTRAQAFTYFGGELCERYFSEKQPF